MSAQIISRTRISAINASIALIFYGISLILQFISRKVFIKYLGVEILGLNSTASSLLQFLNMAELGIGAAVAFSLYKPIADSNNQAINEIIAVQGWFYKRVALFVLIGGIILSFFFPLIFSKTNLPLWYAYSTFGVLLFAALLSYFFNYKQVILSASQLDYKITLSYKGPKVLKDLLQILGICLFPVVGYLIWVVLEGIGAIVCTISLNREIKKIFPEVAKTNLNGNILRRKYPLILVKIKQLLFHKVGAFVLFQMSPLVIYGFTTLAMVAIYGNYTLLVFGLSMLLSSMFNGLGGGIGNIVNTSDDDKILSIFKEVYLVRFILVISGCIGYALCVQSIIYLWVGPNYLLPFNTVGIIILIMFLNQMRPPVELFLQAKGMFNDIWAPIVEATLNLGLSCLFGYFFGLNGILIGIAISLVCIIFLWKPYFLFRWGFKINIGVYMRFIFKLYLVAIINVIIWGLLFFYFISSIIDSQIFRLLSGIIVTLSFCTTLQFSYYFVEPLSRSIYKRIISIVLRR